MAISLSEKAVREVTKVMQEQQLSLEENSLRVGVSAGGCSGFSYKLEFVKNTETNDMDERINYGDLNVVVDMKSDIYLNGTTVDFYEGLERRGFVFQNPNSKNTCGCSNSFSV
jgi:iron-sulfur cluster assembly protein